MWFKFNESLINFSFAMEINIVVNEMGAVINLVMDNGTAYAETFSTQRAAEDRFNEIVSMVAGERAGLKR